MVPKSVLGRLLVAATVIAAPARAGTWSCPAAVPFANGSATIPAIHVYTGGDGVSHIARIAIKGMTVPFFKTGGVLTETVLGPSQKVVVVHGPPNADIPVRSGIGRVMFLTLQGSTTVVLPSGETATAGPGDLVIFDDKDSRTGHGGRTGACGYIALSVAVPDGAPILAEQK